MTIKKTITMKPGILVALRTTVAGGVQYERRTLEADDRFGLLCALANEGELNEAILRARTIAEEFNATATHSRVGVYVLKGHIASTDEEAARAIGDEVRELVEAMNSGISGLDVERIRDAAKRAREMSEILSDAVLADIQRGAIEKARFAFLDLEDAPELAPGVPAAPAGNVARIAALDLEGSEGKVA